MRFGQRATWTGNGCRGGGRVGLVAADAEDTELCGWIGGRASVRGLRAIAERCWARLYVGRW